MKKLSPYNLVRSFGYAIRGIFYALSRERNLRIHFAVGAFVLYLTRYYDLSLAEIGLLFLCIGFVLTCEMFNTAIERTVDMEAPGYHELAKVAKDVAAGAVLVSAVTSVVVGILLLWRPPTLRLILLQVAAAPGPWVLAVCAALAWVILPEIHK